MKFNGRHDNLGDRLIFSCLYNELKRYDKVEFFGSDKSDFIQSPLRFREAFLKALKCYLKGQKVLVFHPPGARFLPREAQKKSKAEKFRDKTTLLAWSLLRAELHIAGISLGKEFDSQHYKRFKSIGVRDKESQISLLDVGINANLCPDMAFLRPPKLPATARQNIMVSLRKETPDDYYDSAYSQLLKPAISLALEACSMLESEICFFSNVEEDREFNVELVAELKTSGLPANYIEESPTDLDYSWFFRDNGVVISNRLHVLLPAMSEGVLPIALVSKDHYKVVNLFKTFGFEEFLVYVEEGAEIKDKVAHLLKYRGRLQKENYDKLCKLKRQVEAYLSSVVKDCGH